MMMNHFRGSYIFSISTQGLERSLMGTKGSNPDYFFLKLNCYAVRSPRSSSLMPS